MHTYLYTDATLATLHKADTYGLIENGVLAISGDTIVYAGPRHGLPRDLTIQGEQSLNGRLITPGLIDCHTHLIYGGSRANEFEMRLNGVSYEEISRSGAGITSTVAATRVASDSDLLKTALKRLDRLLADGVTTVEVKSGYGLDHDTEIRILRTARQLSKERPVNIITTFLGAHAVPIGLDADEYIDSICIPTLKAAAAENLVDMVDGFCENIAFTREQIERVFKTAQKLGLPVKIHAEQLSLMGGAELACQYAALSADHLEHINDAGMDAMKAAGTVAVLLPGAYFFLKETKCPPIDGFRLRKIPIALATDSNPGSSPMTSLLLAMNMGATLFNLTPLECLQGATLHAAKALGLKGIGQLVSGARADFAIWDVSHPAELTYRIGDAPLFRRIFGGVEC
ncbi:imidazolonepropionase [Kordiimonas sp. SCSIO 12610]|uniref:imidazolonepropionase n=1 Tax=Kordiimonas sp. SCSIO 12610 TaxID=2829597 RepID=UPI002108730F|nr:imidazolonepropionase [Kordiimonas sp. SCSIO 12610]UTW54720.1 imidazolonepropionase [Kordiimonas sp. SCSIO 12610]